MKKIALALLVIGYWLLVNSSNYLAAKEITVLYTGQTHALLYPCTCPKEPDGGVSRRATLIKQLRKYNPHTLLLDSGGFFAGGLLDEYTQNTQLDMQRTSVNLKAMELMEYDAVGITDDEFNFGREFLEANINKVKLSFLSCNVKSDKTLPYIIKEVAGTKVGIIGVANPATAPKAGGLEFSDPKTAVQQAVSELKKNKADIIILLSSLGESIDLQLIKEIAGIDIIIFGYRAAKDEPVTKIGSTLVLKPSWQGRHLRKLSLNLENNKIKDYKEEDIRLSDKINDDTEIFSILPKCFSGANCKKEGMLGICEDPGSLSARCLFSEATRIELLVIVPKNCLACDNERVINFSKTVFPGLVVSYLYYPHPRADKLIKELGINNLPAYLLRKEIEKERDFNNIKENLEAKGDFYLLKPQAGGIAYFLHRAKIKDKLDLFMSLYDKDSNSEELLDMVKDFNPAIHFLAMEQKENEFNAAHGNLEIEEYLRAVCVQRYYPESFLNYIKCRSKNIDSSWWEDCLSLGQCPDNPDISKIKMCAKSREGTSLLRENTRLNKELGIMFGPAYLVNNQEIFSSKSTPKKEDFARIIGRK